jgi:hypothetical protein
MKVLYKPQVHSEKGWQDVSSQWFTDLQTAKNLVKSLAKPKLNHKRIIKKIITTPHSYQISLAYTD